MATTAQTTKPAAAPKVTRPVVSLGDRVKNQLTQAVLRNKITVDDLSDLEQHIKKLASILV
jgi:hypothetical protein